MQYKILKHIFIHIICESLVICYNDITILVVYAYFRAETDRLMSYICDLQPHKVKETISINDVRRRILDLTKPLAEIAKHIDNTIAEKKDQMDEIADSEASAKDLMKMINIQVTNQKHNIRFKSSECSLYDFLMQSSKPSIGSHCTLRSDGLI